jgi:hypothetical protein
MVGKKNPFPVMKIKLGRDRLYGAQMVWAILKN